MKTGFKHLSVILLCLALVLSITGCKGSDSTDGTDAQSTDGTDGTDTATDGQTTTYPDDYSYDSY